MIIPILNQVLVQPIESEDITEGGIVIPSSFKENGTKGKIVAKGNGTKERPMKLPTNVICWYIKTAGTPVIDTDGIEYLLMPDREVLGYLEN